MKDVKLFRQILGPVLDKKGGSDVYAGAIAIWTASAQTVSVAEDDIAYFELPSSMTIQDVFEFYEHGLGKWGGTLKTQSLTESDGPVVAI